MSDPATVSASAEWRGVLDRVRSLVTETVLDRGEQTLDRVVPACPDWSARDLLSHVVGLVADVLDGDEPDDHNPGWTAAQVEARRGRTGAELLEEWSGHAEAMVRYLDEQDERPLGDAIIHEQDLRGALGRPGARDTAGLAAVRQAMAERLGAGLAASGDDRGPLALRAPGWTWSSGDGEPGAILEASGFDLFRAVVSRRTAAQLRSYVVAGDVTPYLDAFAQLGDLPDRELPE
ncbi:maleylpyruvate isomerase N-terminal domain-containing protein [Nocardioides sp. C4-1]|uniref:maleylpyruvate isomerase N-terminal domain-containing protein n=1 Tax=Nocardioides sp. C4-1 TaxID=3151851 RepID=UPI0032648C19